MRALAAGAVVLGLAAVALAHEERLVSGRVERIDARARLLVVEASTQDKTVGITIDADTEVRRCRPGTGLAALKPGTRVRVKYLDRGDDRFDTLSALILPDTRGR